MAEKKPALESPAPAADKKKALDTAIAQIEKEFGKGSIMRMGENSHIVVEAIPTGSLSLDIALGIGGVPKGRIIEIYGPESSGKTTLALHIVAEAQKRGGEVAFIDAEHALDPTYAHALGVKVEDMLISQPDTGEQALEIAEALIRSNAIDVIVVDIQDVGLRYYTYYCTMIDLMNAAAEAGKGVMVLDRPNPNGMTVDGPILDMKYASGVGRLPIPVVHGMTLAELALMANGEGWLRNGAELAVVPCENYTHATRYRLPIAPSPNLRTMRAIYLYPSTCYFEATPVSLGRGTDMPFEVYGHPDMKGRTFEFTPRSVPGAKNPPQLDKLCHGVDLRTVGEEEAIAMGVNLEYVIDAYRDLGMGDDFFRSFFEKLIGRGDIRGMIEAGKSADEIKATWAGDVARFREQRRPYLLYPEN